ncbi:(E)-4-hydroxy-3-methylbut-2-enyl-diphosphate synthase [Porphyromonas sp.]|uniref:(E)-4-hydroxy-3-methylbut-2-enyl-diphosphate synthase n=1 Tax=Porphyromonas sp. TaxID=1924944 RepID=UPI0026DC8E90|nr:(E)-4-hydroxy-3-methylbut-2-enyl-diphosphate synthase [Porphyromonas sp.]MDO4770733.1 (E)-4-hydroxy-3-methylbut-2-enyl-diphosphate synthase [Porphyromonas sp.]
MNRYTKVYSYQRRKTHPIKVGKVTIGGDAPIVVQSMTNVNTNDIEAGIAQTKRIVDAGGSIVRFTAQGTREAKALAEVRAGLDAQGVDIPLVADIHFNPQAAYEAAKHIEKVRINPGNFYDPARKFKVIDYTDEEYAQEVAGLQASFSEFLDHCRTHNTAIRIGVNHGSLSDRIMSRYGDTPEGMVESCMEFLSVCVAKDFRDVVISIKASNTIVMTTTVRLLCERMAAQGMSFPLHLGVTEAGDGEDGRVKSATGIGSLLADGIGDTIRVSLSEAPESEIPVGKALVKCVEEQAQAPSISFETIDRNNTSAPQLFDGYSVPVVICPAMSELNSLKTDERPDILILSDDSNASDFAEYKTLKSSDIFTIRDEDLLKNPDLLKKAAENQLIIVEITHPDIPNMLKAVGEVAQRPYAVKVSSEAPASEVAIRMGYYLGGALLRGECAGLWLEAPNLTAIELARLSFGLLQSTRRRITKTEYISCPGCGRTLFDLQETVARVKAATGHLKGLKIGVMGCIVNGPGEMADADYGYVGSSPGDIDLYKGKECVARKIPQSEAVDRLIDLIRSHGDWVDPE